MPCSRGMGDKKLKIRFTTREVEIFESVCFCIFCVEMFHYLKANFEVRLI